MRSTGHRLAAAPGKNVIPELNEKSNPALNLGSGDDDGRRVKMPPFIIMGGGGDRNKTVIDSIYMYVEFVDNMN